MQFNHPIKQSMSKQNKMETGQKRNGTGFFYMLAPAK